MPPQPLTSINRNAKFSADPISIRRYPELAGYISDVIATWGHVECSLGVILARMLGGAARPSMAMYTAIVSTSAQMAALQAAAEEVLSPERLELMGALLIVVKRAAAKRNKIAHWIWGISLEVPDALVLIPPTAVLTLHTTNSEYMAAFKAGQSVPNPSTLPGLDLTKAYAYRDEHFMDIIDEITEVWSNAISFAYMLIAEDQPNGVQYQMLCNAPQIRTELEKAKRSKR
jgi:hypothetical protein